MRFLPCVLAGSLLGALYVFPMEAALAANGIACIDQAALSDL